MFAADRSTDSPLSTPEPESLCGGAAQQQQAQLSLMVADSTNTNPASHSGRKAGVVNIEFEPKEFVLCGTPIYPGHPGIEW